MWVGVRISLWDVSPSPSSCEILMVITCMGKANTGILITIILYRHSFPHLFGCFTNVRQGWQRWWTCWWQRELLLWWWMELLLRWYCLRWLLGWYRLWWLLGWYHLWRQTGLRFWWQSAPRRRWANTSNDKVSSAVCLSLFGWCLLLASFFFPLPLFPFFFPHWCNAVTGAGELSELVFLYCIFIAYTDRTTIQCASQVTVHELLTNSQNGSSEPLPWRPFDNRLNSLFEQLWCWIDNPFHWYNAKTVIYIEAHQRISRQPWMISTKRANIYIYISIC